MRNLIAIVAAFGLLIFSQATLFAQNNAPAGNTEVGIDNHLGEIVPLSEITLVDENGQRVAMDKLVDKPTFLALVYYECPGICSPLMDSVADVIEKTDQLVLGIDYQVLCVSFDPREGPELAREKKTNYLNQINKSVDPNGWRFLTADLSDIQKLTKAVGFKYQVSGDQFLHAGALTVLAPDGKIVRYLLGLDYLPFDIRMATNEANTGKVGSTISRVLTYCYKYDPSKKSYALNLLPIAGAATLVLAGIFMAIVLIGKKRRPAVAPTGDTPDDQT